MELLNSEVAAAGLRIIAMGLGEPKHARQFGGNLAPSVTCVTNQEPVLFEKYGIARGNPLKLLSPDALRAGARAASKGFSQGKATGDQTRLIGTFIVEQNGTISAAHYGKHAGDHPDLPAMVQAWQAAA